MQLTDADVMPEAEPLAFRATTIPLPGGLRTAGLALCTDESRPGALTVHADASGWTTASPAMT